MSVNNLDLNAMSLDELWELHESVSSVLSTRMLAEKEELENRLAQLNRGSQTTVVSGAEWGARLREESRERRKYPQVFPKYQNPSDPTETWAGRGKQPRWLVSALKAGGKIDDFRIRSDDERLVIRR
jgi:DNA-binding protein H-NS